MKVVKFRQHFISEILSGAKNTTWRLFDDKDLSIGDAIDLVDFETKNKFGEAKIVNVVEKKIETISDQELREHGYKDIENMIESHKKYYGNRVDERTTVKIIEFELKK